MNITTNVYSVSRTELARIASMEYLRSFWWFVAPVPIAGILAVIFGSPPMQIMGMIAICWPFSIPARAVLTTTKSSRLFTNGCHLEATPEEIVFIGEYKDGKRLRMAIAMDRVRETIRSGDFLLIRMRMPGLSPIRSNAFQSEADQVAFVKMVADAVERRLTESGEAAP